jgi:hypothetical protein
MNRSEQPKWLAALATSINGWDPKRTPVPSLAELGLFGDSLDISFACSITTTVVLINKFQNQAVQINSSHSAEPPNFQRWKHTGVDEVVDPSTPNSQNSSNIFWRQQNLVGQRRRVIITRDSCSACGHCVVDPRYRNFVSTRCR